MTAAEGPVTPAAAAKRSLNESIVASVAWLRRKPRRAAAILLSIAVYARIIPFLPNLFPSPAIARAVQSSGCTQPLVAAAGYHEPSLVFLVGTDTVLTDGIGAADFLLKGPCRFALIETRHARSFAQRADAIGLRYTPLPRIEGVNVGGGRNLSIAIFRSGDGS